MLKDPVCGKRMTRGRAYVTLEYEGVAYFLCCPLCQATFERSPKAYVNPELGEKVKKTTRKTYRQLQRLS